MSYDEAVAKLLKAAGDYNATVASFNLETAMCAKRRKTAREKMKQAIESLSLGSIHLTLDETDSLSATVDGWEFNRRYYSDMSHVFPRSEDLTTTTFRNSIERLLVSTLSSATGKYALSIDTISKFAGYAKLILLNIDDEIVKTVRESFDTYMTSNKECRMRNSRFLEYANDVSLALRHLAQNWYEEKAVFTPGMKIGVVNLITGKSVVRTIKRCKVTDGNFSIALNESTSIITNPDRIDIETTWYLNTDEYSDIAKAIKWRPIADLI